MFEKVNPAHPDKVADRIAGAMVDMAYNREKEPKCAIEVLIGHGVVFITGESSFDYDCGEVTQEVKRISGMRDPYVFMRIAKQDAHLAENQKDGIRCGDNGIFRGAPVTAEQEKLTEIAKSIYGRFPCDGKYIIDETTNTLVICQSYAEPEAFRFSFPKAKVNPLGSWTGGTDVDSGATNRKLGSDMGDGVTGGGLHGKDLSKADVSVNIYCHMKAQETGKPVEALCAIGDETVRVDGSEVTFRTIAEAAERYIRNVGGFEKFAEWGFLR